MSNVLDVLLIESERGAAELAEYELSAAGHRVRRCCDADAPAFPCRGLLDGYACPLDEGVDVAVAVPAGTEPEPNARELGVVCALRAGVPVVEVGDGRSGGLAGWISARSEPGDVASMCERAVAADDGAMTRTVEAAIARVLDAAGCDAGTIDVRIERRDDRLVVHVDAPDDVSPHVTSAIAVRAVAALTALPAAVAQRQKVVTVNRRSCPRWDSNPGPMD